MSINPLLHGAPQYMLTTPTSLWTTYAHSHGLHQVHMHHHQQLFPTHNTPPTPTAALPPISHPARTATPLSSLDSSFSSHFSAAVASELSLKQALHAAQASQANCSNTAVIPNIATVNPTGTSNNTSLLAVPPFKNYMVKKKTELCKTYDLGLNCKYGDKCSFAHGMRELKAKIHTPANYKTTKCKQYHEDMCCKFGPRCQFLHKPLKFNLLENEYSSYKLFLEDALLRTTTNADDAGEAHEQLEPVLLKSKEGSARLKAFESFCRTTNAELQKETE